ncbi:hypothetical protein [Sedimentitalea todarodis]|uniref:Uncharacterized protein n=1 Tax=Sedimentitalea todarodis TaxID=1631240 RepID=A0ABU3VEA8_9RHOB|nr:hypothetical protein [Sedimentitalea todarodis]MDU9004501.1 hypothetical protein [Sedimentitalea todarodis]
MLKAKTELDCVLCVEEETAPRPPIGVDKPDEKHTVIWNDDHFGRAIRPSVLRPFGLEIWSVDQSENTIFLSPMGVIFDAHKEPPYIAKTLRGARCARRISTTGGQGWVGG